MRKIFTFKVLFAYSFILIIASILPVIPGKDLLFPFSDKVFHISAYLLLSFLASNSFALNKSRKFRLKAFFYAFFLGMFIELIQYLIPYRSFETLDVFANFLGSILGCLLKIV